MIISENEKPKLDEFKKVMSQTDYLLNHDATVNEDYFTHRSGLLLEKDVYEALCEAAKNTNFEGSIQLVSGASFPDIVAHNFYGVEVKSTIKNHWTSIGSSILESTRNPNVERIYLTFGKLGKPVKFISRPYEECLSEIVVTHYPRYRIDMQLTKGETIFDKMGVPYDTLRKESNPVIPVSKYYRSKLKNGESLWWAADSAENEAPMTVKLWNVLSHEEKEKYIIYGYVYFPEVLGKNNNSKYNRYALWLATERSIINTNIRDGFSAGGQVEMQTRSGFLVKMPAAFGRIKKFKNEIAAIILGTDEIILREKWNVEKIERNRILQWCKLVCNQSASNLNVGYDKAWNVLSAIFLESDYNFDNENDFKHLVAEDQKS